MTGKCPDQIRCLQRWERILVDENLTADAVFASVQLMSQTVWGIRIRILKTIRCWIDSQCVVMKWGLV